jgi:hypothetical protein
MKNKQLKNNEISNKNCELCGKTNPIKITECCGNPVCYYICNDKDSYLLLFDNDSCDSKHGRFTVCHHHYIYKHEGEWQDCQKCRNSFVTESYVWYCTNEYNFVKLENPPSFELTKCYRCERIIKLGPENFFIRKNNYYCQDCYIDILK